MENVFTAEIAETAEAKTENTKYERTQRQPGPQNKAKERFYNEAQRVSEDEEDKIDQPRVVAPGVFT